MEQVSKLGVSESFMYFHSNNIKPSYEHKKRQGICVLERKYKIRAYFIKHLVYGFIWRWNNF